MKDRLRFSSLEYVTVFFLAMFCAYVSIPEVHEWVQQHVVVFLGLL